MARWLLKTEPSEYSWDDLTRAGRAVWDGITNALALRNIRAAAAGDEALIYHTGSERRVMGVARIAKGPCPDPKRDDPRLVVVEIVPVEALERPVTLEQIKADPAFAGWDLLRLGRLSFVPVPDPMWGRILEVSGRVQAPGGPHPPPGARPVSSRRPASRSDVPSSSARRRSR